MKLTLITPPDRASNEIPFLIRLFEAGLDNLHLRKPGWTEGEIRRYLDRIPSGWHDRIVLHHHPAAAKAWGLRGAHVREGDFPDFDFTSLKVSAPVHGFGEILDLEGKRDYVLLSPVYDSLSKPDYAGRFSLPECRTFFELYKGTLEVVALGGIDEGKIAPLADAGFHGAAVLGALWQALKREGIDAAFAKYQRLEAEAAACQRRPFLQRIRLK